MIKAFKDIDHVCRLFILAIIRYYDQTTVFDLSNFSTRKHTHLLASFNSIVLYAIKQPDEDPRVDVITKYCNSYLNSDYLSIEKQDTSNDVDISDPKTVLALQEKLKTSIDIEKALPWLYAKEKTNDAVLATFEYRDASHLITTPIDITHAIANIRTLLFVYNKYQARNVGNVHYSIIRIWLARMMNFAFPSGVSPNSFLDSDEIFSIGSILSESKNSSSDLVLWCKDRYCSFINLRYANGACDEIEHIRDSLLSLIAELSLSNEQAKMLVGFVSTSMRSAVPTRPEHIVMFKEIRECIQKMTDRIPHEKKEYMTLKVFRLTRFIEGVQVLNIEIPWLGTVINVHRQSAIRDVFSTLRLFDNALLTYLDAAQRAEFKVYLLDVKSHVDDVERLGVVNSLIGRIDGMDMKDESDIVIRISAQVFAVKRKIQEMRVTDLIDDTTTIMDVYVEAYHTQLLCAEQVRRAFVLKDNALINKFVDLLDAAQRDLAVLDRLRALVTNPVR